MNRKIRYVLYLMILLGLTGCGKKTVEPEKSLVEPVSLSVDTVTTTYRDVVRQNILTAQIVPEIVHLSFEVNGIFGQYYVEIGDKVSKGELLATLNTSDLDNTLSRLLNIKDTARSGYQMEQAGLHAQLQELLVTLESIKKQEVEGNELEVKKQIEIVQEQLNLSQNLMELELQEIQKQINKAKEATYHQYITAPCDGVVIGRTNFWDQNSVGTDMIVITLANDEQAYLSCEFLSEKKLKDCVDYYAFVEGKECEINYVTPEKSPNTTSQLATTKFEIASKDADISIGDSAILVLVEDKVEHVLTVPNDAVYEDISGEYVYLVNNESRIRQNIETGMSDSYGIEVTSGLKEGDKVYVKN